MTDHEVERWLAQNHSSLWGRFFDITKDAGRREAAQWLVGQIESFSDWKQARS